MISRPIKKNRYDLPVLFIPYSSSCMQIVLSTSAFSNSFLPSVSNIICNPCLSSFYLSFCNSSAHQRWAVNFLPTDYYLFLHDNRDKIHPIPQSSNQEMVFYWSKWNQPVVFLWFQNGLYGQKSCSTF